MGFFIRMAEREDYEVLCELFEEADAYHREALPRMFQKPEGPPRSLAFVCSVLADEDAALVVADSDGQLIGLSMAFIRSTPDIPIIVPRRYAVVDDVVVRRASRRSGVGRAMMERVYEWAMDKGAGEIELNVWEFNEGAIAFYEELGYKTATRRLSKPIA